MTQMFTQSAQKLHCSIIYGNKDILMHFLDNSMICTHVAQNSSVYIFMLYVVFTLKINCLARRQRMKRINNLKMKKDKEHKLSSNLWKIEPWGWCYPKEAMQKYKEKNNKI